MEGTQMLALNKKCWDTVAPYFFQVDCLPKYGPYTASEDEIHLFDSIRNKKVLDIGCGSGHSLQYMAEHRAEEVWGLDAQVNKLKQRIKRKSVGIKVNMRSNGRRRRYSERVF